MNSREIDDRVITLAASGWLYLNTFVLYDYETESLWYPSFEQDGTRRLQAISGEFAGRKLEPLPWRMTYWRDWVAANPGSKLMR